MYDNVNQLYLVACIFKKWVQKTARKQQCL